MCACYLERGSLLCSGLGCQSCRRCQTVTCLPSSQTSERPVPTSPRWTLTNTHKLIVHYTHISGSTDRQKRTTDEQRQPVKILLWHVLINLMYFQLLHAAYQQCFRVTIATASTLKASHWCCILSQLPHQFFSCYPFICPRKQLGLTHSDSIIHSHLS